MISDIGKTPQLQIRRPSIAVSHTSEERGPRGTAVRVDHDLKQSYTEVSTCFICRNGFEHVATVRQILAERPARLRPARYRLHEWPAAHSVITPGCTAMTFDLSQSRQPAFRQTRPIRFVIAVLAFAVLASSLPATMAQDDDKKDEGTPGVVSTVDGWDIHYTYWKSPMGKEAPVVILLHGKGQNRLVWKALPLAKELAKAQYAVIAVDLRKHGESKAPEGAPPQARSSRVTKLDYAAMIEGDLEAIKKFIYSEHQAQRLNMRKTGIVAADMGTAIALNWTAFDWAKKPFDDAPTLAAKTPRGQDVQALVLVSPVDSLSGVGTIDATRFLRATGISTLLLYSNKTSSESRTANKMYAQLGGEQQDEENKRIYSYGFDLKLSGTNLIFRQPQVPLAIKKFLDDHVMAHDDPWKDRESRLR